MYWLAISGWSACLVGGIAAQLLMLAHVMTAGAEHFTVCGVGCVPAVGCNARSVGPRKHQGTYELQLHTLQWNHCSPMFKRNVFEAEHIVPASDAHMYA